MSELTLFKMIPGCPSPVISWMGEEGRTGGDERMSWGQESLGVTGASALHVCLLVAWYLRQIALSALGQPQLTDLWNGNSTTILPACPRGCSLDQRRWARAIFGSCTLRGGAELRWDLWYRAWPWETGLLFESAILSQVDVDMATAHFCQSWEVPFGPELCGERLTCFGLSKPIRLPKHLKYEAVKEKKIFARRPWKKESPPLSCTYVAT